jgi:hypothetical protein
LATFDTFDNAKAGSNSGWANASFGTFFLDDPRRAYEFPELTREPGDHRPVNLKAATINLKNPLDLTLEGIFNKAQQSPLIVELLGGEKGMAPEGALEYLNDNIGLGELGELHDTLYGDVRNKKRMEDAGHDGIISQYGKNDEGNIIKEYVVFDTKNIKLANSETQRDQYERTVAEHRHNLQVGGLQTALRAYQGASAPPPTPEPKPAYTRSELRQIRAEQREAKKAFDGAMKAQAATVLKAKCNSRSTGAINPFSGQAIKKKEK